MPISLLKDRWHGLLAMLRKFVTCEGCYKLVFLYHIRLLMNFIGFRLNMPFYLLRSLYKMAKRYKRQSLNSSLFHHGLIRLLLVHHLKLQGDDWDTFLTRNTFITLKPIEVLVVDNPMLERPLFLLGTYQFPYAKNPVIRLRSMSLCLSNGMLTLE
jgi:hypothetical protein